MGAPVEVRARRGDGVYRPKEPGILQYNKGSDPPPGPWAEDLAGYNFKVIYRPGLKNTKPDVLSRRWDHRLGEGGEPAAVLPQIFFRPRPLMMDAAAVASVKLI